MSNMFETRTAKINYFRNENNKSISDVQSEKITK
jgi:hypothetical protein